MIGAIIGDIVGSRFEWHNYRAKDFDFFVHPCDTIKRHCFFTDDSVMSLAICYALMRAKGDHSDLSAKTVEAMRGLGSLYPNCGYGGHFLMWLCVVDPKPYNSCGNGSAMRVSGCGYAASSLEEAKLLSRLVTEVTHNHPEGIKGAEATTVAVYMALHGSSKEEIRRYIVEHYGNDGSDYSLNFTIDEIRQTYQFDGRCQGTVPQALQAFFESTDFEDAIRNAISIGGDSDTVAAITGAVAEAYYGVPESIREQAMTFLEKAPDLTAILAAFERRYPPRVAMDSTPK